MTTTDPNFRELRIAPVMTGGTSLAVWIGGVTAELYRVVNREPEADPGDVYGKLLKLTKTDAVVDVITGTSAGGLNGVLLATAWALRVPTAEVVGLRDVWLDLGSIESLLRKPSERNPPSLLRGDDYFWPRLTRVLEGLASKSTVTAGAGAMAREKRPTDLLVTVTTLRGEPTTRLDDLDQQLNETKQAHTLRFDKDDFGKDRWAERIALAARTSASIPGVFEASYLPVGSDVDGRPGFEPAKTSFTEGRWAVDGGVLVNEPLGAALERIWKLDAEGEVRRVALFVNPTPAGAAPRQADDSKDPPKLVAVAGSAYTAPRNIGISADIDRLREHNRSVRKAVDVRRAIGELALAGPSSDAGVIALASTLYGRFRLMRTVDSVQTMLERNAPPELVQESTKRRMVEQALVLASREASWLPPAFDAWVPSDDPAEVGAWPWGLASIEYAASVLLEMLARAFRLPISQGGVQREDLGPIRLEIHQALTRLEAIRARDNDYWKRCLTLAAGAPLAEALAAADLAAASAVADDRSAVPGDAGAASSHPPDVQAPLAAWASSLYADWPGPERAAQTKADLADVALEVAAIAVRVGALMGDFAPAVSEAAQNEIDAIAALRSIIWREDGANDRLSVLHRLVALHVAAVVFGDSSRRTQLVELVEVSWSAPNALDPDREPDEKLAGTEFSRLGAFIKPAWRANDWMWGRMDGAFQLVLLLLDPARLRQLGVGPDTVISELMPGHEQDTTIRAELAFLADADLMVPRSLPECSKVIASQVQTEIAKHELPAVYDAVLQGNENHAVDGDGGGFRRAYEAASKEGSEPAISEVAGLVRRCRIGEETAGEELGQDALTRTAGRMAIVMANAVTGDRAGVPWPAKVVSPLRQVGLAVYAVTESTTTASKTGIGISAAIFALAGAIVAMNLLGTAINVGLVFLASLILLIGAVVAIMRSGVWSQLPVALAIVVITMAMIGPDMADVITSDGNPGTTEALAAGDEVLATGTVEVVVKTPDGQETSQTLTDAEVAIRPESAAIVRAGEDADAGWKDTLFLDPWSVATVLLIVASVGWVISLTQRSWRVLRRYRRNAQLANAAGRSRPPLPLRPVVEIIATLIVIPALFLFQKPFFAFVLTGPATETWRSAVIRFSTFLGERHMAVVIGGLVVIGIFFGLAWDRGFRLLFAVPYRALRRALH